MFITIFINYFIFFLLFIFFLIYYFFDSISLIVEERLIKIIIRAGDPIGNGGSL